MMEITVLINPTAGSVSSYGVERLQQEIKRDIEAADYKAKIFTGGAQDLQRIAGDIARADREEPIVCAGGDGTLAAVATALMHSRTPLVPLPGGTMNLFVQDLNIPNSLETALCATLPSQTKSIDVAMVNERAFLNNVVFGAYAALADARETVREANEAARTLDGIMEVAEALRSADPQTYRLQADGLDEDIFTNIFMVANNLYTGANLLRPVRQRINQGRLGLYIADSMTGLDFISQLAQTLTVGLSEKEAMRVFELTECQISSPSELHFTVDGDPMTSTDPVSFSLEHKALRVICPAPE